MQIKQEGELQLQEQQALGVEAWAAGQPDIGEEPWGLSQLDSGAGDVSTDATSGEWPTWEDRQGGGQARGQEFPGARGPAWLRSFPSLRQGLRRLTPVGLLGLMARSRCPLPVGAGHLNHSRA